MKRLHLIPVAVAGFGALSVVAGAALLVIDVRGASERTSVPDALVGTWRTSSVSGITYRDRYTYSYAPPSGSSFSYTLTADGRYENSGLLQSTLYSCTMSVFKWQRGNVVIAGERITLTAREGTVRTKKSCGSSSEEVRPHLDGAQIYTFKIEQENGRSVLVLTKDSGEHWGRFYRQ